MSSPKWTNQEHKKVHAFLPAHLEQMGTKISFKYIIIEKHLHWQRDIMGLVKEVKTLGVVGSSNCKIFH